MSEIKTCPQCGKHKNVSGKVHITNHGKYKYWVCGDCNEDWMEHDQVLRMSLGQANEDKRQLQYSLSRIKGHLEQKDKLMDKTWTNALRDEVEEMLKKYPII